MELNKIEKQFKEQLNSREIKPSEMAWDKLDAMLNAVDSKPKRNFKWLYVAAGILAFLLAGTVYFNRFEFVRTNKGVPLVLEQKTDKVILNKQEIIKKSISPVQIQKKVTKNQAVAVYNNNPGKQLNQFKNKLEPLMTNTLKEDNATAVSPEENIYQSTAKNQYISAEKLLAEVNETKFQAKTTVEAIEKRRKVISVNPNELLLNAEKELNQSFRESALDKFNKNFKAVKTVIVNRNYEE
ncbi:hypothetical protein [Flavobacterium limi]|uniref:Anti-sigma factor n=1 Tax=Flavobacterium limi TaxID=2045105 RepID=A0ABQ1TM81_9FLAO|nr:hypothetical protein [Flavobacterium limi]GGE96813.1 hypothetical protein GCM10011518_02650 [Flavobacterium limi]